MALHEQDRFGNLVPVSFLSRLTFSWVNKSLQHGNRSQLQEKDLLELPDKDSTPSLEQVLESAWRGEEHLQGANPDRNYPVLLRALFKVIVLLCSYCFDIRFISHYQNIKLKETQRVRKLKRKYAHTDFVNIFVDAFKCENEKYIERV